MTRGSTRLSGGTGLDCDRIQEECRWLVELAGFVSDGGGFCAEQLRRLVPHFAALAMPLGPTLGIPLDALAALWARGRLVAACPKCGGLCYVMGAVARGFCFRCRWYGICPECRSAVAGRNVGLRMLWHLMAAWAGSRNWLNSAISN